MSPSLRGSVDVSPVLQHRADILSDGLQCSEIIHADLVRDWKIERMTQA